MTTNIEPVILEYRPEFLALDYGRINSSKLVQNYMFTYQAVSKTPYESFNRMFYSSIRRTFYKTPTGLECIKQLPFNTFYRVNT